MNISFYFQRRLPRNHRVSLTVIHQQWRVIENGDLPGLPVGCAVVAADGVFIFAEDQINIKACETLRIMLLDTETSDISKIHEEMKNEFNRGDYILVSSRLETVSSYECSSSEEKDIKIECLQMIAKCNEKRGLYYLHIYNDTRSNYAQKVMT